MKHSQNFNTHIGEFVDNPIAPANQFSDGRLAQFPDDVAQLGKSASALTAVMRRVATTLEYRGEERAIRSAISARSRMAWSDQIIDGTVTGRRNAALPRHGSHYAQRECRLGRARCFPKDRGAPWHLRASHLPGVARGPEWRVAWAMDPTRSLWLNGSLKDSAWSRGGSTRKA